jgi:hypothetical protein
LLIDQFKYRQSNSVTNYFDILINKIQSLISIRQDIYRTPKFFVSYLSASIQMEQLLEALFHSFYCRARRFVKIHGTGTGTAVLGSVPVSKTGKKRFPVRFPKRALKTVFLMTHHLIMNTRFFSENSIFLSFSLFIFINLLKAISSKDTRKRKKTSLN